MENGEVPRTVEEKLTPKQRKFADEYIECMNASEAARRAGYSVRTAAEMGYENLRKAHIKRYIDERLSSSVLGKQEVLTLFSRQAIGDIADLLDEDGSIDIEKVKSRKYSHLVESYRIVDGKVEVKLVDKQYAATQLGKFHKLFTQKVEVDANLFFNWSDIIRDAENDDEHSQHSYESGLQDHSETLEA